MSLGTAGEIGFVASVAIGEAMGHSTGDGGGVFSFFCYFEAEAAVLASMLNLFLDDAPHWVLTIMRLTERKTKRIRGASALRGKDE